MTDELYATDAYLRETDATVLDVHPEDDEVLLDKTVCYPGGGGQPHDVGELVAGDDRWDIVGVRREGRDQIWHDLDGGIPSLGDPVRVTIDWDRRYRLMRTHTALHALCGIVWDRYEAPVTGSSMSPGEGRLDFELPDWDPDDQDELEAELNEQLQRDLPVEVDVVPREEADRDPSLIRTKVSLLPGWLEAVRVIDIVGLDRQADGGTHVASTGEVGRVEITKVESKGRGFRRFRIALVDREAEQAPEGAGQAGEPAEPGDVAA